MEKIFHFERIYQYLLLDNLKFISLSWYLLLDNLKFISLSWFKFIIFGNIRLFQV